MWHLLLLVLPLLHLLGLLAAVHAILKSSTPQGAIAWSIALMTFPVVVLPFYLVFGSTHFDGYVNPLRAGSLWARTDKLRAILEALEGCRYQADDASRRPTVTVLERLSRTPFTGGCQVELLVDGGSTYARMTEEIQKAQDYVLVLFYKVLRDSSGQGLKDLLIEKARQGVRVYFVFDEMGSTNLGATFVRELRQAGVQAWPFRTTRGWRHTFQLNFRNHRKIVVVDGRVALVGGVNIADKYRGLSERYGPWRDTHVVLQGPAVMGVQLVFLEDYYWATKGQFPEVTWRSQPAPGGQLGCTYLSSGPADRTTVGVMFYLECITAARHRLWLASPYFLPDPALLEALKIADMRGVDVRILIPPGHYEPHMRLAFLSLLPELRHTGIKFYEYPGYNHSKAMLVDDWLSWVGSSNLDNRSLRLNFEGNLVVLGEEFASRMQEMLQGDFERARPVSFEELGRFGLATLLGTKVARLFLPLL